MAHARRAGRQIFLDTETTGTNNQGELLDRSRVVEIGCIELDGRWLSKKPEGKLQLFINPEMQMDNEVIKIHGLTNEFLADKPKFADIIDEFIEFIRDGVLYIHNADFDIGVLDGEFARCGKGSVTDYVQEVVDTIPIARKIFPGRTVSLDNLCSILEIDLSKRQEEGHGALLDSMLLAEVYLTMTRGQNQIVMSAGLEPMRFGGIPAPEELIVLKATEEELKEHNRILDDVEKNCKGVCDWRKQENPVGES